MKKRTVVAITACAIGALALLLGPLGPLTGATSQGAGNHQAHADPQSHNGRLLHLAQARDCGAAAGTQACTPEVRAIALSDRGELIEGSLFGTAHAAPGPDGGSAGLVSPTRGTAIWTYPDGSTLVARAEDASKINRAGQLTSAGSQTCIFGTGRFADVDCTIDWSYTAQSNGLFPGAYSVSITPKA